MSEVRNTQVVQAAYAAFVRGDIGAILDLVDDQVDWQGVIGGEGVLPNAGRRQGRAAVAEFFAQVGQAYLFEQFEPREFVAQGDMVAAIGHYRVKIKHTGAVAESAWAMVFSLRDGKITRFREFTDSAALVRAYTGVAVTA